MRGSPVSPLRPRGLGLRVLALAALFALAGVAVCAQAVPQGPAEKESLIQAPEGGESRSPFTLSIGADSGILWGMATELVYVGSYRLSELDYPLQPLVYAGGRIELGAFGGLDATARFAAGIPTMTGSMTDSDYLNYNGVTTNFSESQGYLERALLLDVRVGWKVEALPFLVFEPFAAFRYLDVKWSAHNGYLQYPPESSPPYTPWSPSEPKVPIYGTVLTYNQVFSIPAAGLRVIGRLSDRLTLDGSVALSPFAFLSDVDEHPLRYLIFYDSIAGGFYLEPERSLAWEATENLELSVRLSYLSITEPNTGTTVMLDTNPSDATYGVASLLSGQSSGATFVAFGAELGARLKF